MKFIDSVRLSVKAGKGGNGCMSFLRERFRPFGGPDGGNGGRGGNIIFEASNNLQTLADLEYQRNIKGKNGNHGRGSSRNGAMGEDTVIFVPCGTIIYDALTDEGLADLVEPGDRFLAARGGRGGRGNRHFASSTRKAPRFCENGDFGEKAELRLELRLIADIGLVGMPNVGKSSILAAISNAQPKIANYPFTTLSPNLGVLVAGYERVILADIPGLIEGAHMNRGLGIQFLRHIARTRLLIHVLSLENNDPSQLIEELETVRNEMRSYDPELDRRPYAVAANKLDLSADRGAVDKLAGHFASEKTAFCAVSALTGEGIPALVKFIAEFTEKNPRPKSEVRLYALDSEREGAVPASARRNVVQIVSLHGGGYRVIHGRLEKAAERCDFSQDENVARFIRLMRRYKVEDLLEAAGAKEGDQVTIGHKEFIFYPDYYPSDTEDLDGETEVEEGTAK